MLDLFSMQIIHLNLYQMSVYCPIIEYSENFVPPIKSIICVLSNHPPPKCIIYFSPFEQRLIRLQVCTCKILVNFKILWKLSAICYFGKFITEPIMLCAWFFLSNVLHLHYLDIRRIIKLIFLKNVFYCILIVFPYLLFSQCK